jgi:uncharacterized membrane protein YjjB (DUF3815 family)
MLTIFELALWAGLGAFGFAMLFNVPLRALPGCALCAFCGFLVRATLLGPMGANPALAALAGSAVVGFVGVWCARFIRVPQPTFTITGVIPMVPGSLAFQALIGLIRVTTLDNQEGALLLAATVADLIQVILIFGALAVGIAIPILVFQRRTPIL